MAMNKDDNEMKRFVNQIKKDFNRRLRAAVKIGFTYTLPEGENPEELRKLLVALRQFEREVNCPYPEAMDPS